MADQSFLSERQDELMCAATEAWQQAKEEGLGNTDSLLVAARRALEGIQNGGAWPETIWVESLLSIGANCCATAVLNHGQYELFRDVMGPLYQEVLDRRWLKGGPSGHFDEREAMGLSKAVGQWQLYRTPAVSSAEPPKKKGFFRR
jgi:hypothetical protein